VFESGEIVVAAGGDFFEGEIVFPSRFRTNVSYGMEGRSCQDAAHINVDPISNQLSKRHIRLAVLRRNAEQRLDAIVAEREGFEPPVPLRVRLISSQVHSTGLCHLSAFNSLLVKEHPLQSAAQPSLAGSVMLHGSAIRVLTELDRSASNEIGPL
jgi:hypothetical protein